MRYFYTMKVRSAYTLAWIVLSLAIFSCTKEEALPWRLHKLEGTHELSAIRAMGPDTLVAVGGSTWYAGHYAISTDGGERWQADSLGNKQLFGVHVKGGTAWAIGIDGYLFEKRGAAPWAFHRLSHWDILRDVTSDGEMLWAAGGVAFSTGVIYGIRAGQLAVYHPFPHELQWIEVVQPGVYMAGGYGLVLRSSDAGESWTAVALEGDYFRDACFINDQLGFIAGYSGHIWKTTDGGLTWKKVHSGSFFNPSKFSFRAIEFYDESLGIVAGNGGQVFITRDGGDSWLRVEDTPDAVDWHGVTFAGTTAWLCGSDNHILETPLR